MTKFCSNCGASKWSIEELTLVDGKFHAVIKCLYCNTTFKLVVDPADLTAYQG